MLTSSFRPQLKKFERCSKKFPIVAVVVSTKGIPQHFFSVLGGKSQTAARGARKGV